MFQERVWEVVIVPDPTDRANKTIITATETVPLGEPITASLGAVNKTQADAVEDFVKVVMFLPQPYKIERQYAGYWCAVYTVTQSERKTERPGADTYPGVLLPLTNEQYDKALGMARQWLYEHVAPYFTTDEPWKVWNRLNANYAGGIERFITSFHEDAAKLATVQRVQSGEQAAYLCGFCREAFSNVSHRDHHEKYLCPVRPGLRGDRS